MAGVPLGNPDVWTSKVTVPGPVIVPLLSRGTLKVMMTKPRPLASSSVIGGTSLAGLIWAVKVSGPVVDGPAGLSSPQAAARPAGPPAQNNRVMLNPR